MMPCYYTGSTLVVSLTCGCRLAATTALKPVTDYSCTLHSNILSVTWGSEDNMKNVKERGSTLLQGCKCVTGCSAGYCGCWKRNGECLVGCNCINCTYILQGTDAEQRDHQ